MPTVQRVSVLDTDLSVHVEQRPVPRPGPGEVLVRVRSVGVCGSDIHYFEHGRIADFVVESPLVLGHESSGTVVAVGAGVDDLPVGTTVAMEPGVPCASCEQCRAGRYNLCPDVQFFATPPVDGTFCEYVVLPRAFAHPVPAHVSFDAAALVEPLSVGVWACQKAKVRLGTRVLVTGAGPVGMMAALVARANGASEITVSDTNPDRLGRAASMGFATVDPRTTSLPDAVIADVLLECSGAPTAIDAGIRAVAPAGTVVLVGMSPSTMVELPVGVIQGRELWVTGTFRYAHTYPTAIDLVSSGRVDLDALVSRSFALEEAEQALTYSRTDPAAMKVMVHA
ncbi:MAG TPA: NAD(P)-dependent alcohol dehydrogenase [Actinobacteria bacterium]|nr:NAD(P)-dependent alcohol dehydrogenase [Actinomycetota bacterium]